MKHNILRAVTALSLLALASCSGVPVDPVERYHAAVSPEYLAYVNADAELTPAQKARRSDMVQAFGVLLEAHK